MIYLPIILIPTIFGLVWIIKPKIRGVALCAVCVSVSVTWLILLLSMFVFIIPISPLIIGILMGMSVIGGLSKLEPWMEKQNMRYIKLIKLIVIIGGLYSIYFFLEQEWKKLIITIVISAVALIIAKRKMPPKS
jgi:hypothetical protein